MSSESTSISSSHRPSEKPFSVDGCEFLCCCAFAGTFAKGQMARDSHWKVTEPGGSPARWIHNAQSIKDLSEQIHHKPTSWVNKPPPSWSLTIYGGWARQCCSARTCAGKGGHWWVGGIEFIASRWGASDHFPLPRQRAIPRVSSHKAAVSSCLVSYSDGFPTFPGSFGAREGNHTLAPANKERSAKKNTKKHKDLASSPVTGDIKYI